MVRAVSSACLAIFACVLVALGVVTIWMDNVVLDTEGYVRVIAPFWNAPAVREKAAKEIGQAIAHEVDVERTLEEWYPDCIANERKQFEGVMRSTLPHLARGRADEYVASPAFESVWRSINTSAHASVLDQLETQNANRRRIAVDIELAESALLSATAASGARIVLRPGARWSREVEVFDAGELARVRALAGALRGRGSILLGLSVISFVAAVWLSSRRRVTLALASLGVPVAMTAILAGLSLAERICIERLVDRHLSPALVEAMFDAVAGSLRATAWTLLAIGLAVFGAVAVALLGRSRP